MTGNNQQAGNSGHLAASKMTGNRHSDRAFTGVKNQCESGQFTAASAQHIGGADIAAANAANITTARDFGKNQAKWHTAKQIGSDAQG